MRKALAGLMFLLLVQPAFAGRTLHLTARGMSFTLTEPEGWQLEFGSAVQVADFVMHPTGMNWRHAGVVAFGRFLPRSADQTLKEALNRDIEAFQERCPFYDTDEPELALNGSQKFEIRGLHCPGFSHEVVAFTEVPRYFVSVILSSSDPDLLKEAYPAFAQLLSSFSWQPAPPRKQPEP